MHGVSFCSVVIASVGCNFPEPSVEPPADAPMPGTTDLLLTEVRSVGGLAEFIEIWNPTVRTVALDRYYLSDFVDYWRLPSGGLASLAGDFLVRFPEGAYISPNEVKTIALRTAEFTSSFGSSPSFAIDEVAGPRAFSYRIVNVDVPTLSDNGEPIALFRWDGASDLVRDVDLMITGPLSSLALANSPRPKDPVDGPDADASATAYRPESFAFGGGMAGLATTGTSYKRRRFEAGAEIQLGTGNGLTGDDETSEQLQITWDGSAQHPFTAPSPGTVPPL